MSQAPAAILIEDCVAGGIPLSHPIYAKPGFVPMANVHCEMWGNYPAPEDCIEQQARCFAMCEAAGGGGAPCAVKLTWCFTRTTDVDSTDKDNGIPSVDQVVKGIVGNALDYSADRAILAEYATRSIAAGLPERTRYIFADNEGGPTSWGSSDPDANTRCFTVIQRVLSDTRYRPALPPSLASIDASSVESVMAAFNWMNDHSPGGRVVNERHRDWWGLFNALRARSFKSMCFSLGLMGPHTQLILPNFGAWRRYIVDGNGWEQAHVPLPGSVCSNMQVYGPAPASIPADSRRITAWAASMADANGAGSVLTFSAADSAEDIADRANVVAQAGGKGGGACMLWTERLADLDRLAATK